MGGEGGGQQVLMEPFVANDWGDLNFTAYISTLRFSVKSTSQLLQNFKNQFWSSVDESIRILKYFFCSCTVQSASLTLTCTEYFRQSADISANSHSYFILIFNVFQISSVLSLVINFSIFSILNIFILFYNEFM